MADKRKDRQKKLEELSLEELEQKIKKDKKKVAQNAVFIMAAAFALIALCNAWFVSNTRVNGIVGRISAKKPGIEIGSRGSQKGSQGVHDDILKAVKKSDLTYHLPNEESNLQHDTSQGGSINWLLNEDSNMKNYSEGKSFTDTGAKFRKDYAMEPGTKGRLDFFIKSYEEGNLSLEFSLDIVPYVMDQEGKPQVVDKTSIASQLLSGHIVYFLGETKDKTVKYTWIKDTWKENTWIKDGRFQITIPNAEQNKKYYYSIYWVWPLNLSTILLNENDEFLNGSPIEFDDKDPDGALRNQIISDMTINPGKYFFSSLTETPLDTNYEEVKAIGDIHTNSGTNNPYDKQLFVDLSSYYNQADMKIGGNISFITATLKYLGKTEETNEKTEAKNED